MTVFEVGQTVFYNEREGIVAFVDESYITVSYGPPGPSDVKILVFPPQYDQVQQLATK